MIHRFLKILTPVLQGLLKWYLRKPRPYRHKEIHIIVNPGVFYPRFVFSTKILLEFLDEKDLKGKKFLELGAGCGIISLLAAGKGAEVTASDINPAAIENIKQNAVRNHLELNVIESNLFMKIMERNFDMIVIAPPYYPKMPRNFSEMAWFCGEDFDYFTRLFTQLTPYASSSCEIIMILSEDCDIMKIKEIAGNNGLELLLEKQVKRMGEWNYIFRIRNSNW
jgi:release factor glutamine methyltransferase